MNVEKSTIHHIINILLILTGIVFILLHPNKIAPDCSLHLTAAELIIIGQLPFVSIFDTNPPMAMYLATIPCLVAKALHVNPIIPFNLFSYATGVISILSTCLLLQKHLNQSLSVTQYIKSLWLLLLLYLTMNTNMLGQREMYFAQAYFPFLVVRTWRHSKTPIPHAIALLTGVCVGIVLCMKHYFLIPVIFVEFTFLLKRRSFVPLLGLEVLSAATVGAIFVSHLLLLPSIRPGFAQWVTVVWSGYSAYSIPASPLLLNLGFVVPVFIIVITGGLFGLLTTDRTCSIMLKPMSVFCGGCIVMFQVQHKGWAYHFIPALWGACAIIATLIYMAAKNLMKLYAIPSNTMKLYVFVFSIFCFWGWFKVDDSNSGLLFRPAGSSLAMALALLMLTASSYLKCIPRRCYYILIIFTFVLIYIVSARETIKDYWSIALICLWLPESLIIIRYGLTTATSPKARCLSEGYLMVSITFLVLCFACFQNDNQSVTLLAGDEEGQKLQNFVRSHTSPGDRIASLAPGVDPTFTFINQCGLLPATRFLVQYPICMSNQAWSGAQDYKIRSQLSPLEQQYIVSLENDLDKYKPNLLLVFDKPKMQGLPATFSIVTYLSKVSAILTHEYSQFAYIDGTQIFVRRKTSF